LQTWAILKALPEVPGIWKRCGLHPGDEFQKWIRDVLAAQKQNGKGITTVQQLLDRMKLAESGLTIREGVTPPGNRAFMVGYPDDISKAELKLVTSDIVTQTKVVFPDMADLYYAVSYHSS
jgi:NTE family protein